MDPEKLEFLKRHSLVISIILMFLLTWPVDLANLEVLPFQVPFVVALLAGWGFVFASSIMMGLTLGKEGLLALLKRFLMWRVGWTMVSRCISELLQGPHGFRERSRSR